MFRLLSRVSTVAVLAENETAAFVMKLYRFRYTELQVPEAVTPASDDLFFVCIQRRFNTWLSIYGSYTYKVCSMTYHFACLFSTTKEYLMIFCRIGKNTAAELQKRVREARRTPESRRFVDPSQQYFSCFGGTTGTSVDLKRCQPSRRSACYFIIMRLFAMIVTGRWQYCYPIIEISYLNAK